MEKVGGEAVAQVDGGRSQLPAPQKQPLGDARLGIKMGPQTFRDRGRVKTSPPRHFSRRGKFGQSGSRPAEMTRDIEPVPRPRSGAAKGFPRRNVPDQQDIRHGHRGFSQVPSGESSSVRSRESEKSVQEAMHPRLPPAFGQS